MLNRSQVTEDLCANILARLPVKTVGRFRCVSKPWNSLISSPWFESRRIRIRILSATIPTVYFGLSYDNPSLYALYDQQDDTATKCLAFPLLNRSHNHDYCLGVVHGVICLAYIVSENSQYNVALWNPTVCRYATFPLPLDIFTNMFFGFGFSHTNNDFKVVCGSGNGGYYEVLSARSGVWRRKPLLLPDHVSVDGILSRGCFQANGIIHWVARAYNDDHVLLLFDCESEVFETMELPQRVRDDMREVGEAPRVLIYGGLLSVLGFSGSRLKYLWTMKEYGNASSWCKQRICEGLEYYIRHTKIAMCAYDFEESMLLMDIGKPYDEYRQSLKRRLFCLPLRLVKNK